MSNRKILAWGDVAYAARIASTEVEQEWQALEWIWQAWGILIQFGLATYSTKVELYEVVIRFLALVSFCLGFFDSWANWGYDVDAYYLEWIEAIDLNGFQSEQFISYVRCWNPLNKEEEDTEDELDNSGLLHLTENAHQKVHAVLTECFGSRLMLFNSLWQSKQPEVDEYQECEEEGNFCQTQIEIELKIRHDSMLVKEMTIRAEIHKVTEENEEENAFYETKNGTDKDTSMSETIVLDLYQIDESTFAANRLAQAFNEKFIDVKSDEIQNSQHQFELSSKLKPKYSLSRCAEKTGFKEVEVEKWLRAINRKKQAVLYGPPGTGKTYIADKLAKHLIGGSDGFLELVQFHPTYSYEDFIQGIRPQSQGEELKYSLVPGCFLEFCEKAESRQGQCVLIIDEINRANITQVFGELMYLLEYRDRSIPLAGGGTLRIPDNVRIIGTMNTADRSIALIDYALRRRFAFIELRPQYEVLRRYHEKRTGFQVNGLIEMLKGLNKAIDNKHYEVGISFFLIDNLDEQTLEDIWSMEIEPYLEEYFFNQLDKVNEFRWEKIKPQISLTFSTYL